MAISLSGLIGLAAPTATLAAPNTVQRVTASDPSDGASFGQSVAVDGDIAVVGAPSDPTAGVNAGAIYVYRYSIGRGWAQEAKLIGLDTDTFDRFGWSVAICQQRIVVGAYSDTPAGSNSGSAYVFHYTGSQWVQEAKLVASDAASFGRFGWSVAIDQPQIVVGAYSDSGAGFNSGAAYVFRFNGSTWSQTAKLTAGDASTFDFFGYSVSIYDEMVAVGAPFASDLGGNAGLVYVFDHTSGAWLQSSRLAPTEVRLGDQFGRAVSIYGQHLVAGAPLDDTLGVNAGILYHFELIDGGWAQQSRLGAKQGAENDQFGWAVKVEQSALLVGAVGDDDAGANSGAAYLFTWGGGGWGGEQRLAALAPSAQQRLGCAVGMSGDQVLVGAYSDTIGAMSAGAAYGYTTTTQAR